MILIVYAIIYIAIIFVLSIRLKDISINPEKYEDYELVAQAKEKERNTPYCKFFKSLSHQYMMVFFPIWILLAAVGNIILLLSHKAISGSNEYITTDGAIIGIIPMFFILLIFTFFIMQHIKTPYFVIATEDVWVSDGRAKKYFVIATGDVWVSDGRAKNLKISYILLLIFFVVGFPFYALSANSYVYYNEEGITSSRYFELGETYTDYDDIQETNIYYGYNSDDELYLYYEVVLSDGKVMNLITSNLFTEDTLNIHKMLEQNTNCTPNITPLTSKEIDYLYEHLSEERAKYIIYIFEGFH